MRKSRHQLIRDTLLAHEDGLTKHEICRIAGLDQRSIRRSLIAMPDVYIDRWVIPAKKAVTPVYVAVDVPKDCFMPNKA